MADLVRFRNFVNGQSRESASGRWLASTNPYTGAEWAEVPHCGVDDVNDAIEAAHQAFTKGPWATLNATARGKLLRRLADLIARDAERLAEIEVRDNGKLLAEMLRPAALHPGMVSAISAAWPTRSRAASLPIDKPDMFAFTEHEPMGVVARSRRGTRRCCSSPGSCAPALAAGNTVVIKPSEFASASTLELAAARQGGGLPRRRVQRRHRVRAGGGRRPGRSSRRREGRVHRRRRDRRPRSTRQAAKGTSSASRSNSAASRRTSCSRTPTWTPPCKGAISGIFAATGQTCIAGSRLLVQTIRPRGVRQKVVALAGTARLGDPMQADTQVGPITTAAAARQGPRLHGGRAEARVRAACSAAARRRQPDCRAGWFVEPTIFGEVSKLRCGSRGRRCSALFCRSSASRTRTEAIEIANDTIYGLAAGVWTIEHPPGLRMADRRSRPAPSG